MKFLIRYIIILFLAACGNDRRVGQNGVEMEKSLLLDNEALDIVHFDSLRKLYPESDFINGMFALALVEMDSLDAAKLAVDNFKLKGTYTLTALALLFEKGGDEVNAAHTFAEADKADASQTNKWLRLYRFYHYKRSDMERALQNLKEAIKIDPSFNRAKIELAYEVPVVEQCDSVISLLESVDHGNFDEVSLSRLGEAYYYCGSPDKAATAYIESIKVKPNGFAFFGLGTLEHYEFLDFQKAEEYYKKASSYTGVECLATLSLAWLRYDQGAYSEAASYLHDVISDCPSLENYIEAILVAIKINDLKSAQDYVAAAQETFGSSYQVAGLELVLKILSNGLSDREEIYLMKAYHQQYGDSAVNWLSTILRDADLDSKVDVDVTDKS